jgi:hypothetical protein
MKLDAFFQMCQAVWDQISHFTEKTSLIPAVASANSGTVESGHFTCGLALVDGRIGVHRFELDGLCHLATIGNGLFVLPSTVCMGNHTHLQSGSGCHNMS